MDLKLHERIDRLTCSECGGESDRVYGDIFDGDRQTGAYSADLGRKHHDRRVLLAIGTLEWDESNEDWREVSVTLAVWPTESEFQMSLLDASESPYRDNELIGRVLDRDEALASPLRDHFFHLADEIVVHDPRVNAHLDEAE